MNFLGKCFFITGASRGIGKAIALKLARKGASIVIAAKSVKEDERLGGTIYSAASEIEQLGAAALPVVCDIRDEEQIMNAVLRAISVFGGIDGVINNASAIDIAGTEDTTTKHFDLINDINVRGTFLVTKHCIPFLKKSPNPHILTLSPPLNIGSEWLSQHLAYSISKYNMIMMTLGWAEELKKYGIAANSLWPATTIATAAVKNILGGEALLKRSRNPEIVAEAAYHILKQKATSCTGNLFLDEDVLRQEGITDFSGYAVNEEKELQKDMFVA